MAKKEENNDQFFCSFCGKNQKEVKKLIAGPSVYICNECIKLCGEIIEDEEKENAVETEDVKEFMVPKQIKELLDSYVIEQDRAKRFCLLQCTTITSAWLPIWRRARMMWKYRKATC